MKSFARCLSALLAVPALALMPSVGAAQYIASGSAPAFGGGTISGGAPLTLSGVAGGPVELSRVDGACRGYAQATPNHVLNTSGGPLRITTNASGDATFLVRLPDGRMLCDDDGGDGFNPLIDTSTGPGRVEIWVGSYGGSTLTYTLMASGGGYAPPPPPSGGSALFGNLTVGAGMRDPAMGSGRFGGPMPASSVSSGCPGHISSAPSHLVTVTSYMPLLRFVVNGDADTTLMVQFPDGHISCNDDGGGYPHPLVEEGSGPGTIRVWVGSYSSGTTGNYLLGVTTNPSINATNLSRYSGGGGVVVAPPPPVVVTPPPPVVSGAVRVDLDPRIPVTLYGIGVTPTVAVWSPRRGPSIEVSTVPRGSVISVSVTIDGALQSVFDVPSDLASGAVVMVTERGDGRLLVRAERAPGASDPGSTMLWLLNYAAASGAVSIAESWAGTASERGPRWSR